MNLPLIFAILFRIFEWRENGILGGGHTVCVQGMNGAS